MSTSAQGPLKPSELTALGPFRRLGREVHCFGEIDSTNQFVMAQADALSDGAIVAAEWQSAGRGRFARRWEAPRGASILLTVLLIEQERSDVARLASLLGAVAACEAIREATGCEAAVRWPNDVTIDGKKTAGVLSETRLLGTRERRAIALGIGVNCWQQAAHFPPELREKATSLELCTAKPVSRSDVAARLIRLLDDLLWRTEREGPDEPMARWRRLCGDIGRRVTLRADGGTYQGVVLDIDAEGALLVQLDVGGRLSFDAARTTRLWGDEHDQAS